MTYTREVMGRDMSAARANRDASQDRSAPKLGDPLEGGRISSDYRVAEWSGEYGGRVFSPEVKRKGLFGRTVWEEMTRCSSLEEARAYIAQVRAGYFENRIHPVYDEGV